MEIIAIIPARGGSKGIPGKNIIPLGRIPLIAHTILAARYAPSVARVVVSTDDGAIAETARQFGAEAPFLRPARLSGDDVPDFPVILHALEWLRENDGYAPEALFHLRPTYPFVLPGDMEACVRKLAKSGADSVRTICESPIHPFWTLTENNERLVPMFPEHRIERYFRRQELPSAYRTAGVDLTRTRTLFQQGAIIGREVAGVSTDPLRAVDIDTPADLELARAVLETLVKKGGGPEWWS